jgi:hypothetical protein
MNERDIRTIKRLKSIKAAISKRALTRRQLATAIHMCDVSAGQYVAELLAMGSIHISDWDTSVPNHIIPKFRWGAGENKPRPYVRSKTELESARMKRIKADTDAHERHLARHRAHYAVKKAVKKPNTWMGALC